MDQPTPTSAPVTATPPAPVTAPEPSMTDTPERPGHVPDKFWDHELQCVRTDALLKSYGELERRLGNGAGDIPDSPASYRLKLPDEQIQPDPDVNARLHAAGFTQAQAQLVYDLAREKLSPLVAETTADMAHAAAVSRLEHHFGGTAKWQETARQIKAWGQAHLPAEAFDSLSGSVDGVIAIHRMMKSGEPSLIGRDAATPDGRNERDLKQMMKDPRYWRDQEVTYVEQVRRGFQALYPD